MSGYNHPDLFLIFLHFYQKVKISLHDLCGNLFHWFMGNVRHTEITITVSNGTIHGDLCVPETARAVILFAHGSGSSRFSSRNKKVAAFLWHYDFATLLFDLLTETEDADYNNRFQINLLAHRLLLATDWIQQQKDTGSFTIGYYGASTGAAAALQAAAQNEKIKAIVSRGGRPDLAMKFLPKVKAPALLIVGSRDLKVLEGNRMALQQLGGIKQLELVAGATHLFEEPGAMEQVSKLAADWFQHYLITTGLKD